MRIILLSIIAFGLAGCQTAPNQTSTPGSTDMRSFMIGLGAEPKNPSKTALNKYELGSQQNPITVQGVLGQREYISKLVCTNGELVSTWERIGSIGESPYGFVMDIFKIICDTNAGVVEKVLYMDMYHTKNETRAAAGFLRLDK